MYNILQKRQQIYFSFQSIRSILQFLFTSFVSCSNRNRMWWYFKWLSWCWWLVHTKSIENNFSADSIDLVWKSKTVHCDRLWICYQFYWSILFIAHSREKKFHFDRCRALAKSIAIFLSLFCTNGCDFAQNIDSFWPKLEDQQLWHASSLLFRVYLRERGDRLFSFHFIFFFLRWMCFLLLSV